MSNLELLAKCYESGDVISLFSSLNKWSRRDLRELLKQCDEASEMVDKQYGDLATKAEFFFSTSRSKSLDSARFQITCELSEIASVALFYLPSPPSREQE